MVVSDLDAAGLAFIPHVPEGLGAPVKQVVTEVDTVPDPYREVGWVYDHSSYGLFVIRQRIVNKLAAETEIEELAAHPTPGCEPSPVSEAELGEGAYAEQCYAGERSLHTLTNGTSALIFVGENTTFVVWVETLAFTSSEAQAEVVKIPAFADPALYVQIIGPSMAFSREDALAVADGV